jgi:phospholipid/cholesterol/gamma-HCH transport system substrate-binding protein
MKLLNRTTALITTAVVLLVIFASYLVFRPGGNNLTITADFPRTVSLYEGSDVKILGVPVGKVDKITPMGTKVRVQLHFDGKYPVPAGAKAAVVSPSIVGDRFVQLTPAYTSGPKMQNDAHLGLDKTATPLELDEIFSSINDLDKALGPNGANKADAGGVGPLTRLLDSTARNFGGQGVEFNKTLKNVGAFTQTLADNKDALFNTLNKVEDFTSTLKKNDTTVRQFNDSLAKGANLLAGERQDLAAVLRNLSVALVEVRSFVHENRASLSSNIAGLNQISKVLVKRRDALDEILRVAPAALNNLYLAGNVKQGTLDTRDNAGELTTKLTDNPAATLCTLVGSGNAQACDVIKQALGTGPLSLPRPKPFAGDPSTTPRVVEPTDPSMGGLVGGSR